MIVGVVLYQLFVPSGADALIFNVGNVISTIILDSFVTGVTSSPSGLIV